MAAYLAEPRVPTVQIQAAGGILEWWERQRSTRPRVTAMAIAYLTSPGKSTVMLTPSYEADDNLMHLSFLCGCGARIFRRSVDGRTSATQHVARDIPVEDGSRILGGYAAPSTHPDAWRHD